MLCTRCNIESVHRKGEWQCLDCQRWYCCWWDGTRWTTSRVRDREQAPKQWTAQEDMAFFFLKRWLERKGYRYMVDFGYRNAEDLAQRTL